MKQIWWVLLAACGGSDMEATPDAAPDAAVDAVPVAALPDLRFKSVGAFPAYEAVLQTNFGEGVSLSVAGPSGFSPPGIGGGDSWEITQFAPTVPVAGRISSATATTLANAAAAIGAVAPGSVITGVDYTSDEFAMIVDTPVDPAPVQQGVAFGGVATEADLAGYVATAAAHHQVVTALGFDGTRIAVLSYGGDTQSYETSVLGATLDTIPAQAAALGAGGYIITAFGRTSATGYTLVGTRVAGATAPRDVMVASTSAPFAQGYVIVGRYFVDVPDTFDRQIFER